MCLSRPHRFDCGDEKPSQLPNDKHRTFIFSVYGQWHANIRTRSHTRTQRIWDTIGSPCTKSAQMHSNFECTRPIYTMALIDSKADCAAFGDETNTNGNHSFHRADSVLDGFPCMGYFNFSGPIPMCNLFHSLSAALCVSMGTSSRFVGTFIIARNWAVHWTVRLVDTLHSINCLPLKPTTEIYSNAWPAGILMLDNFICVIKRIFSRVRRAVRSINLVLDFDDQMEPVWLDVVLESGYLSCNLARSLNAPNRHDIHRQRESMNAL